MAAAPPARHCAGLLLTGGASRRFGAPKAEIRRAGERLADRNARVLSSVATPVLEVGPGFTALEAIVEEPPGSGPLAALAAGADALARRGAGALAVLVLAVDLPFADGALVAGIAGVAPGAAAVVPRVEGRAQPLCARYAPSALERARTLVADGARAMQALLDVLDVHWLDEPAWSAFASARAFVDVDTPDDARRIGVDTPG